MEMIGISPNQPLPEGIFHAWTRQCQKNAPVHGDVKRDSNSICASIALHAHRDRRENHQPNAIALDLPADEHST